MSYYENPAKQTRRIEFLRNKKTGKIVKAQRDQMKELLDTGNYETVSSAERTEIEAAEAEKKAEEQAKRQAEADARPLYKNGKGVPVHAK